MNHKFYSVNVSNSSIKKHEINLSSGFILEKELKEIYDTHYNNIFPKILSKTKTEFITLLKEQITLHLKIINKKLQNSLNSKYLEFYTKKYFTDKNKVTRGLEELIKNPDLQVNHLDILNCFIHCHKCSSILHKCKNKIILYKNYIYCLCCQNVYNENQIKLYCRECKTCYYTKLRYTLNKKYENFFPVSFKNYHCPLEEQEKIKCLECGYDLYYNITYENNKNRKNSIIEVFCLKCKLLYDLNEIYFKCKICKSDFKSEAQLYSSFSLLKIQFLLIMHCLRKKKLAAPEININRKCKCNISKYDKYLHQNDNGVLYLGHNLEGQYVIICDGCYSIFKYNEFLWNCPLCGINFKSKKMMCNVNHQKTMTGFGNKVFENLEKKPIIYKSPSHLNLSKKNIIENQPPSAEICKVKKNNIVQNLFKKNNSKFELNNNNSNHKTKVILLTNGIISDRKQNINLSDQKANLFKRLNNKNYKNRSNFNSINYNNKETSLRKSNFKMKNTNNNTINSLLNYISFSNNKSETNTNKLTDSTTANITYRNNDGIYEKINEDKNIICRCPSCLLENEYNRKFIMDDGGNKINRKLIYDDFVENEKENDNNDEMKDFIRKSKTCIEAENFEGKKEIIYPIIKKKESRDNLIKNKEKQSISQTGKDSKFSIKDKKLKDNIKIVVIHQENKNKKLPNIIVKKDISIFNNSNADKNNVLLGSIENSKNNFMKTEFYSNNNNIRKYNSQNKINNIKSLKNINIKSNDISKKNYNGSQNKIKNITSIENISKNYNSINNITKNIVNTSKKSNEKKEEKKLNEIKEINSKIEINMALKYHSKCNSQNKNLVSNSNLNKKNNNNNNLTKKQNSIFDKIKQYYEDCINEEEILFKNNRKYKNKDNIQNKNVTSVKKKIEFKTDFKSDNYSILKLLGRGTYGKTYLVEDPKTKERFALKKISINDKIELKENKDEYNLILSLTKEHPDLKIINIYGIEIKKLDKYSTVMYILMEAANCDWEKEIINRCNNNAFYKESQLIQILIDLVKTFAILQKNGISHRDVKPQNILCFGKNGYKISDFGEAKNLKKNFINKNNKNNNPYEDNTIKQTLRGTELYMSPILFQALRTNPYQCVKYNSYKSDVFSLGMCLFLASCLDYEGLYEVREIIKNPKKTKFVLNRYLNMKYSQKYINLLISMLQINEKDRPDFIELEKILENN